MAMRWQIAKPGEPLPIMGAVPNTYAHNNAEPVFKDSLSSDAYNQFGAMHGTIIVSRGGSLALQHSELRRSTPDRSARYVFPKSQYGKFRAFSGSVVMTVVSHSGGQHRPVGRHIHRWRP